MELNKKQLKKLEKIVGASNIDVVVDALNGKLIKRQYDTKTKRGMLKVAFNNKVKELKLQHTYDGRDKFISKKLKDTEFIEMWNTYEAHEHTLAFKPVLRVRDDDKGITHKNTFFVKYSEIKGFNSAKKVTHIDYKDDVIAVYESVNDCIKKTGKSRFVIKKDMDNNGAKYGFIRFEDGDYDKLSDKDK